MSGSLIHVHRILDNVSMISIWRAERHLMYDLCIVQTTFYYIHKVHIKLSGTV